MNIKDFLVGNAGFFPDKTAIVYKDVALTYKELYARTISCAASMKNAGVNKGDNVCIACRNSIEYLELMFGCSMLGAVPALINWRMAPVSVLDMAKQAKAKMLFVSNSETELIDFFRTEEEAKKIRLVVVSENDELESDYESFLNETDDVVEPVVTDPSDPALILYTSGTTGRAKGVVISGRALITQIFNSVVAGRWDHNEVFLCVSPICHSISLSVMAVFCVGGTLVLCPVEYLKDPDKVFSIFKHDGITRTAIVPTVIERLVSYAETNGIFVDSMKTLGYGASPMNVRLIERCKKVFNCGFHQGYGMTEAYGTVTALLPEDHEVPELLNSVGRPMMGCSVRIKDENGNILPVGEIGEINIRSDSLMSEYLGMPELTASVIVDGWYHTGDIGYVNEQGYLFLTGRKKDMIITGGENVFPSEIENCISDMTDSVNAVCVAGVNDDVWGEIIVAAVVRKPGSDVTEKDIISYCAKNLANYKKPKKIKFVDALPATENGKISRVKVRELFK